MLQHAADTTTIKIYNEVKLFRSKSLDQYWYAGLLGVDPNYQRRGIGAKLVEQGLSMAREGGLPMVLEATVAGKGLYVKLGFKQIRKLEIEGLRDGIVTMLWEPEGLRGRWLGEEQDGIARLKEP